MFNLVSQAQSQCSKKCDKAPNEQVEKASSAIRQVRLVMRKLRRLVISRQVAAARSRKRLAISLLSLATRQRRTARRHSW